MVNTGYQTSLSHVLSEMERIDLLIRHQLKKARHVYETKGDFHGLYISDDEAIILAEQPQALPPWAVDNQDDKKHVLNRFREKIDVRILESIKNKTDLRLINLVNLFGLAPNDVDILLICLAPEVDHNYERIFAYLQDDVTKKRPCADFILNLLSVSYEEKLILRKRLREDAPLLKHGILHFTEDVNNPNPTLLSRYVKVDERIVAYILDENTIDAGIRPFSWIENSEIRMDGLVFKDGLHETLKKAGYVIQTNLPGVLFLSGPYGSGKKSAACAMCRAAGKKLFVADAGEILKEHTGSVSKIIPLVFREATLQNALVLLDNSDAIFKEENKHHLKVLYREIERTRKVCFISVNDTREPGKQDVGHVFMTIAFPVPVFRQRLTLWEKLTSEDRLSNDVDLEGISNKFAFTGGQIRDALTAARNKAYQYETGEGKISASDLYYACRLQTNRRLSGLSRKLTPSYTWSDIVLPEDRIEQLREIVNHMKHRSLVLESWGFGKKLSHGKGLNILFTGPSGTGKTMSAEIMAGDLGLDLYKIDLARIVSKYIGETEKNLSEIFHEAETSHAILFFDEADAIFGKRSEVHDAHDRYANIETSYLLQKMEEYEGMTILATNFKRNIDDAFVRRIQHAVDFPFPDQHHRKQIWQKIWPSEIPLCADLDMDFLAGRFELSGGNIKNISLNAAFIAAANGHKVTMDHVVKATQREYQKMGKLMMGHEFAGYRKSVVG